jgi:hypothetical protein
MISTGERSTASGSNRPAKITFHDSNVRDSDTPSPLEDASRAFTPRRRGGSRAAQRYAPSTSPTSPSSTRSLASAATTAVPERVDGLALTVRGSIAAGDYVAPVARVSGLLAIGHR